MLNPYYATLAQVLHDERVAEALQRHRLHSQRGPRLSLPTQLLLKLSNRLVDLGKKLKALATQPPQELAEA